MTFLYTLVFIISFIELIFVLLLILPLGSTFQNKLFIFLNWFGSTFKIGLYVIITFIFILFVNSVGTSMNRDNETLHPNMIMDPYSHCKIFYAQRNIYLTLGNLVMIMIIYRIPQMVQK